MRLTIPFLLVLAGCSHNPEPKAASPNTAAVAVSTIAVRTTSIPATREIPGTVRARTTTTLSAKLMAYVRDIKVNSGDSVQPGQVLITLDSKDFDAAIRQAESARREAQSTEAEITGAIGAARAQLDLANTTHKRMKELHEKRSISNQEFDEATARLRLAQANHEMAIARRQQLASKIDSAAQAVETANLVRSHISILSPFAGIVTERKIEPGALVTPGAPLLVVEQSGGYRLEVPVEERLLSGFQRGQRVEVWLEATGRTVSGPISEIVPSVDPISRAGTVKIDIPSTGVRSGMFGRARFPEAPRQALLIPLAAIRTQGSLQSVFVLAEGAARSRLITLGERHGENVEVLSGITENDRLVHPLPPTLEDGTRAEARQ